MKQKTLLSLFLSILLPQLNHCSLPASPCPTPPNTVDCYSEQGLSPLSETALAALVQSQRKNPKKVLARWKSGIKRASDNPHSLLRKIQKTDFPTYFCPVCKEDQQIEFITDHLEQPNHHDAVSRYLFLQRLQQAYTSPSGIQSGADYIKGLRKERTCYSCCHCPYVQETLPSLITHIKTEHQSHATVMECFDEYQKEQAKKQTVVTNSEQDQAVVALAKKPRTKKKQSNAGTCPVTNLPPQMDCPYCKEILTVGENYSRHLSQKHYISMYDLSLQYPDHYRIYAQWTNIFKLTKGVDYILIHVDGKPYYQCLKCPEAIRNSAPFVTHTMKCHREKGTAYPKKPEPL